LYETGQIGTAVTLTDMNLINMWLDEKKVNGG